MDVVVVKPNIKLSRFELVRGFALECGIPWFDDSEIIIKFLW